MAEGGGVSSATGGVVNSDGAVSVANSGGYLDSGRSDPVSEGHDHDEEDHDEECPDLEPFFYDEAEAIADNERRMRRELEEARKLELHALADKINKAVRDRILDNDPKKGGVNTTTDFPLPTSALSTSTRSVSSIDFTLHHFFLLPASNIASHEFSLWKNAFLDCWIYLIKLSYYYMLSYVTFFLRYFNLKSQL